MATATAHTGVAIGDATGGVGIRLSAPQNFQEKPVSRKLPGFS
jgi:hypothetical protein